MVTMMWDTLKKFGLEHCDLPTMLWNVAVMLRALTLNIDVRNKKPISVFVYIICLMVLSSYFYVYFFSMAWFVFVRCQQTGDLLAAFIVFSLGTSSEIGTVKLVFMFVHIGKIRQIVTETLACDATVVPGSRFSKNLMVTLRSVKKRALVFWSVIIFNGVVYVFKPLLMPGRHLTEDQFILYVQRMLKKWRNVRDYYQKEKKRCEKEKEMVKTNSNMKRKRLYNYFSSLTFLDNRNNFSHSDKQNHITTRHYDDDSEVSNNEEYVQEEEDEVDEIQIKLEPPSAKRPQKQSITTFQTRLLTTLNSSQDDASHSTSVKNFLQSLVPDVQTLNEQQYMSFRLGVLNLINNIKFGTDGTNESWVISTMGLEPMYETPNYEIASILMALGVVQTCYPPANVTAFLIVITGYIEGQMLALTEELLHLWQDAEEHYNKTKLNIAILDENESPSATKSKIINEYISEHLKDIINIHARNINLLRQVEDVYRTAIALEFFLLVIGLISELLGGLENTYLEVPFALMQVGMDCFTGQRVMDASTAFERAVYDSKWEKYDKTNMKTIQIMLQSSQKTMKLSAGGVIMLSFSCLMLVNRSIYSAYTTLRSTMK